MNLEIYDLLTSNNDTRSGVSVQVSSAPESEHPYVFDVKMMAIVAGENSSPNMSPREYAIHAGATMLYPFIRETVANLTMRGRFGTTWLKPYNVQAAVNAFLEEDRNAAIGNDEEAGQ